MENKEHGLYVSSIPSSAAKKAVSKLCATDKKRKVEFSIREITNNSKKKTYGPYLGHMEKLKKPVELKGRVIWYKPVAKLNKKSSKKIMRGGGTYKCYTKIPGTEFTFYITKNSTNRNTYTLIMQLNTNAVFMEHNNKENFNRTFLRLLCQYDSSDFLLYLNKIIFNFQITVNFADISNIIYALLYLYLTDNTILNKKTASIQITDSINPVSHIITITELCNLILDQLILESNTANSIPYD